MTRKYFGTDGIRGRVGLAPITPDFALQLGAAAGSVLSQSLGSEKPTVLIGKDTRISGYMLESALEAGFSSVGVDVILCGPLPTPGVAYLTRALRADAGIVISASHNPYDDNGIKFFSRGGIKLPDSTELAIETQLDRQLRNGMNCVESAKLGRAKRLNDAAGRYVEFCKSTFPSDLDLRGLHVAVDCAHGAAYHVAPAVFHELGAKVTTIADQPDGFNINQKVGATHPEAVRECVLKSGADVGIALDGDADRLVMIDRQGRIFNGDELLYILAQERRRSGGHLAGVVGTLMTNLAVESALKDQGTAFVRAKVGDRYVLEELHARQWVLGGEGSGHLLVLDKHTTGDGIISCLQILAALQRTQRNLSEMLHGLSLFPQTLINVHVSKGFDWRSQTKVVQAEQEVLAELGPNGRVLLRASGTEPVVRVMVEARDEQQAQRAAQKIAQAIQLSAPTSSNHLTKSPDHAPLV